MTKNKTKVVEATETLPTNALQYNGTVTIKKIKRGRVISTQKQHNKGYKTLFTFLLNCLAGRCISSARPSWCYATNKQTDGATYKFCSGVGSSFGNSEQTVDTDSSGNPYIEYKFYFPYQTQYNTGFDSLALFSEENNMPGGFNDGSAVDTDKVSMIVDFSEKTVADKDTDLLVIWRLEISNNNGGSN